MENKVYSQVYSILKTSKEGVLDAIKGLASIGFDGIEAMGTNTGGLSKADFHKFIDDLGIRIIPSTACGMTRIALLLRNSAHSSRMYARWIIW